MEQQQRGSAGSFDARGATGFITAAGQRDHRFTELGAQVGDETQSAARDVAGLVGGVREASLNFSATRGWVGHGFIRRIAEKELEQEQVGRGLGGGFEK